MPYLDKLADILEERGINQTELGRMVGMGSSAINPIVRQQRNVHESTAQKIAEGLGLEVTDLYTSEGQGQQPGKSTRTGVVNNSVLIQLMAEHPSGVPASELLHLVADVIDDAR